MSKNKKERRCKICKKLLIDEKFPVCKRCVLEGRNRALKIGGVVGTAVLSSVIIKKRK